jgi:hypothetical protein
VHARHLERRAVVQPRQQSWQPPRQHRLADAGRAHHEQIVAADRGKLECPARERLAAHVRQVWTGDRRRAARGRGGGQLELAAQPGDDLGQMMGAVHGQARDQRGLGSTRARAYERLQAHAPRGLGRDQRPVHRTHASVERKLAEHQYARGPLARELVARGQDGDRHRQVVPGSELRDVAGRQVDDDAALRPPQLARDHAGAHALARLADRAIREADDDRRSVLAPAHARLDLHELALDPDRRLAVGGRDHAGRLGSYCATGESQTRTHRRNSERDGRRA